MKHKRKDRRSRKTRQYLDKDEGFLLLNRGDREHQESEPYGKGPLDPDPAEDDDGLPYVFLPDDAPYDDPYDEPYDEPYDDWSNDWADEEAAEWDRE